MFDVAFSELLVIGVVALVVIGPEKLPKVARTLGLLAGRMQRYVNTVKSDIQREMQFQDLQKLQSEIQESVNAVRSGIQEAGHSILHQVNEVQQVVESSRESPAIEPANDDIAVTRDFEQTSAEVSANPTIVNAVIESPAELSNATSEIDVGEKKATPVSTSNKEAMIKPIHPQAQLPLEPPQ